MDNNVFNAVQLAACSLMESDLRFIYTIFSNFNSIKSNYITACMPYIGTTINGIENWIKSYNQSSKYQLLIPQFTKHEKTYYDAVRDTIKFWGMSYDAVYSMLYKEYFRSEMYFSSICTPLAKDLELYDIFGADLANGAYCGNTILCGYYLPIFDFGVPNGPVIMQMSQIIGKYIKLFHATDPYPVNKLIEFDSCDFGGFVKSPVGNEFSDKFVLFCILCQINFILFCIDQYIDIEIPAKLRFSYLLYHSLLKTIPSINVKLRTSFSMDNKWDSTLFRNAMAHYKLGVLLREDDLIYDDLMYGLVQKIFSCNYADAKNSVIFELKALANQLGNYLGLSDSEINGA